MRLRFRFRSSSRGELWCRLLARAPSALLWALSAVTIGLPDVFATLSSVPMSFPKVVSWSEAGFSSLAPGFKVQPATPARRRAGWVLPMFRPPFLGPSPFRGGAVAP